MFLDFVHSLRSGEEAQFDLAMARRDMESVEAVYRSVEE